MGQLLGRDAGQMLERWAPAVLRALYERDARRSFCPPAMWLAPFNSSTNGPSNEARFSAAAVTRAILQAR